MLENEIPYETGKAELEKKAPLIDMEGMSKLIRSEILDPELLERTNSIWLHGSFVEPSSNIDANDGRSDLDVFVSISDWDLPIADSGIAAFAPQAPTPSILNIDTEKYSWETNSSPEREWNCTAEAAWEEIPPSVQDTLINTINMYFCASKEERENQVVRQYDFSIGDDVQLKHHLAKGPGVRLWDSDRDGHDDSK